ncbi:hypothetical protein ACCO45_007718, partial [Purpureocillium lilacinum]
TDEPYVLQLHASINHLHRTSIQSPSPSAIHPPRHCTFAPNRGRFPRPFRQLPKGPTHPLQRAPRAQHTSPPASWRRRPTPRRRWPCRRPTRLPRSSPTRSGPRLSTSTLRRLSAASLPTSRSRAPCTPFAKHPFPRGRPLPYARSPSVDATSIVSGSAASGVTASGAPKKKRGRKAKNPRPGDESAEQTPSLVGGKAPTTVSGQGGGDKDAGADDDDDDENQEMALEEGVARTQEQKQEEIRLRAMLVEAFDSEQYNRYELWRAAKLSDAVVKRVVNATVSQSVPQMVSTAVKAVAKLFAGEIIESARNVQAEWITAGEKQSDLPTPPPSAKDAASEEEPDLKRGPLRPDHLREAWRRYRSGGESRGVGMQQLWHAQQGDGVERFSTRTGKRLFK